MRMIAKSPAAVAAAFSKSWRPIAPGESVCAAMPEPMTMAASKAAAEVLGEQAAPQRRLVHCDRVVSAAARGASGRLVEQHAPLAAGAFASASARTT